MNESQTAEDVLRLTYAKIHHQLRKCMRDSDFQKCSSDLDIDFQLVMLLDQRFVEELIKNNPINLIINIQVQGFFQEYINEVNEVISVTKISDHGTVRLSSFERIILDNRLAIKKIDQFPAIYNNSPCLINLDTNVQINGEEVVIKLGRTSAMF